MSPELSIRDAIFPFLEKYRFCVSACGIRYGSVLYVAFGECVTQAHQGRPDTTHYPVEFEFGADDWHANNNGKRIIDSQFDDIDDARSKLRDLLVGRRLIDVVTADDESQIIFNEECILLSRIAPEPASGFLFSFHVEDGPTWETVDGQSMQE
jgi:hypothetical protein